MAALVALLISFLALADSVPAAAHPLDPLSREELETAVAVLKAAGHVDRDTRFVFLSLREPDKSAVLDWKPGQRFQREAFAIIKQGRGTF